MDLRKCCDGASDVIIASVKCPKNCSLNSALVTRESSTADIVLTFLVVILMIRFVQEELSRCKY